MHTSAFSFQHQSWIKKIYHGDTEFTEFLIGFLCVLRVSVVNKLLFLPFRTHPLFTFLITREMKNKILQSLFTRENLLAFALALIMIALVICTADNAPTWIYQGF